MHRVKIHQGDITKLEVDAIVCASEDCIGFAAEAAGENSSEGEVSIIAANNLSAEFVIHTLGPVWRGGDQSEEEQLLAYRRGERASGGNAKIMQGVAANLTALRGR